MGVCMSIDEDSLQIVCGPRHKGKKKIVLDLLNAESKVCDILSKMPRRICTNGSTSSACAFSKQGRKGTNQDSMLVWEEFAAQTNTVFCGIFDGHGPNGHLISRKVRDSLPVLLALPITLLSNEVDDNTDEDEADIEDYEDVDNDDHGLRTQKNHECDCNMVDFPLYGEAKQWKEKFVAAYKLMDRNLKSHPKLHCFDSGTTAVSMVVQGKELLIGNVGDSRAVLARRCQKGSLVAHQLTIDLKPNLPGELERIKRCKGRVFALEDEPYVARVWVPYSNMPGLAMARALGDFCLKEYGLSATPQVFHRKLMEEDEFIVLASDGLWDVLSNEEVVRIVASTYPKEGAAKALVQAAVKAWKKKYGAWRTDDCSVVCFFIKDKLTPTSSDNIGDNTS